MVIRSQGGAMKLRPLYFLSLLCISALQSDCVLVCTNDACENSFNLLAWCATSNVCRVNGQLVTTCGEGSDCPLNVLPGTHYEIPLEKLWPELRTRNDLGFSWKRDFKDESNVAVFLDDVQVTEGVCQREAEANWFYVTCPNLLKSVSRLEFDFIPPKDGSSGDISMTVGMGDWECVAAHAGQCD